MRSQPPGEQGNEALGGGNRGPRPGCQHTLWCGGSGELGVPSSSWWVEKGLRQELTFKLGLQGPLEIESFGDSEREDWVGDTSAKA